MVSDEGGDSYWRILAEEIAECAEDFRDEYPASFSLLEIATYRLADRLKDEMIPPEEIEGLWADLLGSAMDDVDWDELAEVWLGDVADLLV